MPDENIELDMGAMCTYISNKTGLSEEDVQNVLYAESDYMKSIGLIDYTDAEEA